jgi:KipI family sensor histidine kinase inhibitor
VNEIRTYLLGERAVVLESSAAISEACQGRIWRLAETLSSHPGVAEVVPGMNNLTVLLDPQAANPTAFLQTLRQHWLESSAAAPSAGRLVEIPVRYGGEAGPDLAAVARHCGLSPEEVVRRHTAPEYTVYFLGFQPGFAYLGGLDAALHTPRRAQPRLAVPAGSVGIGGAQTGIYPSATPGGWQLIGRTDLTLFNPQNQPCTLLQPGDRVRFVALADGVH